MEQPVSENKKSDNRTRNIVIGVAAAVVAVCCCLVLVAGVLVVADPFNWNLIGLVTGGRDEAAAAIPPGVTMYMGVDLLETSPEKINRLLNPFIEAIDDPDFQDTEAFLDDLDDELMAELGLTFSEDIRPWLGQQAGLGVADIQVGDFGDIDALEWYLILSTRDQEATDRFLAKLEAGIVESSGDSFTKTTYEDVEITYLDSSDPLEQMAFGRSGNTVFFGAGLDAVMASVDSKNGDSLADTDDFRRLMRELPGNRAVTFFVSGNQVDQLVEGMRDSMPLPVDPSELPIIGSSTAATAVTIVDEGLRFDIVTLIDSDTLSDNQRQLLEASAIPPQTDEKYPDSTVVYVTGQRLDLVWASLRDGIAQWTGAADFDESMTLLANELGINPDQDLFPLLDGEWAIGVVPSVDGLLVEELDLALGASMLSETSQPAALSDSILAFNDGLRRQMLVVDESTIDEVTRYQVLMEPEGEALLSYGLANNFMFLSTDDGTTGRVFGEGPSLADNEDYQQAWRTFPGEMNPVVYVNMAGLLSAVKEGLPPADHAELDQSTALLRPIKTIAVASDVSDGDVRRLTAILFIEEGP